MGVEGDCNVARCIRDQAFNMRYFDDVITLTMKLENLRFELKGFFWEKKVA